MEITREDLLMMGEEKADFIARMLMSNKNSKTSVAIAKNYFFGEKSEEKWIEENDHVVFPKLEGGLEYGKVISKFRTYEWKLLVLTDDGIEKEIPYRIAKYNEINSQL